MKAVAVFPETRRIDLVDVPEPSLSAPTQVKVRVLQVGICGTDREIASFDYGSPPSGEDFLIVGHEALAQVVQVGGEVHALRGGDLVVPMVRRPCPHERCTACRAGRQDFCTTGDYTERGIKGAGGFMCQYVVDEERYFVPIEPALGDIGVLTEPLTIAEKGIDEILRIQRRLPWGCPGGKGVTYCHRALVLGAGPVGLLGAMALAIRGFQTCVFSHESPADPPAEIVRSIGATYGSARETSIKDFCRSVGNIDVVYEATGDAALAFETLQYLGINGIFAFTGVPAIRGDIPLPASRLMRDRVLNNQVVFGTVNAGRGAFEAAAADLLKFKSRWGAALSKMIAGPFPMEEYGQLLTGKVPGIKRVMAIAGEASGAGELQGAGARKVGQ